VSSDDDVPDNPVLRVFAERSHVRDRSRQLWLESMAGRLTATGWPSATPPVNAEDLYASAQRHAVRAFRARANDDHHDAALQFGVMLEHLAKAYLVGFHPTLVLERNFDFPTLLRLAGQGQRVKPGHVLKTIGLRGALERFGEMEAGGTPGAGKKHADRFELLMQARDGVAHIGAPGGPADEVAELAVRGAAEILDRTNRPHEHFFGDWAAPARALLDEHATKVHRLVQLRLSLARDAFALRFAALDDHERTAQLAALDVRPATVADDTKLAVVCPACTRFGLLTGTDDIDFEPDWDVEAGESYLSGVYATVVLTPDTFSCPVCGLRLHGAEQLTEAGLDTLVELREATEEDLEAYESDRQASAWEREPDTN
jgi:rubredoxin